MFYFDLEVTLEADAFIVRYCFGFCCPTFFFDIFSSSGFSSTDLIPYISFIVFYTLAYGSICVTFRMTGLPLHTHEGHFPAFFPSLLYPSLSTLVAVEGNKYC